MSYSNQAPSQVSLFTQPDNLSATSPVEQSSPAGSPQHQDAETKFLEEAYEYAVKRVSTHQDSAVEFISGLVKQFGYGIRMYVLEIAQRLIKDPGFIGIQREYIDTSLNAGELLAVLQEKPYR